MEQAIYKILDMEFFAKALSELGHDPENYRGKKLALNHMVEIYEIPESVILTAIENKMLNAFYDYGSDTIWVDALEAAHFHFCNQSALL